MKQKSQNKKSIILTYLVGVVVFGGLFFIYNQDFASKGKRRGIINVIMYISTKNTIAFWIIKSILLLVCLYLIYKIFNLVLVKKGTNDK